VVTVNTRKTHPLYRKQYTVNSKFMAHDEENKAEIGDKVMITECRPLSARKRFTLTEIIEKPALSQDSLGAVSSTDSGQKSSKSKAKDEEANASTVEAKS
jgi:small subunit ribosomal protein S17